MKFELLKKFHLDSSLIWGFLFLSWSFISGPLTSIIILIILSPEVQGYYYLFLQLSVLAQIGDMGLNVILFFMIARSYGKIKNKLNFYKQTSSPSSVELTSLLKFVYKYSVVIPIIILPIIYFLGVAIISNQGHGDMDIRLPWMILCIAMSLDIASTFLTTQIESFNQIALSNKLKLLKVFLRSLILWALLLLGFNLESIGYSILISVIVFLTLYLLNFKNLIFGVIKSKIKPSIIWSKHIWPLQWKTALSFFFGALILYNSSIIAVFYFLGAAEAGKFGISLAIIEAIIAVATLLFNIIQPKIAFLINDLNYQQVKKILLTRLTYAIIITITLGFLFYLCMILIEIYFPKYYLRFLPKEYIYLLILAGVIRHLVCAISIFVRAHKSEDLMPAFVVAGLSTIALNIILIPKYGLLGASLTYLVVKLIFHFPLCLFILRKFLHKNNFNFQKRDFK
jgi:O-antigen/teichoic acid export membrane protein